MFQPARLNRAMVASCKLPLGIPSLSLLATKFLFLALAGVGAKRNWPREAAHRALMAHQPVALHLHAKQQRVVIAIRRDRKNPQPVAAGLAFHPKLLARAAPERDVTRFQRARVALRVEETQHQHLAAAR